jgi:ferric-dicitrate binding protein FerR (iron transport regulator)
LGIGRQVDQYLNKLNVTQNVNTSYEWAGGGLVSTTKGLERFLEALFEDIEVATITMTEIDYAKKTVSGTFSFDAYDEDDPGKRYQIRAIGNGSW